MNRETLILAAVQSGILFLAVWLVFRLVPSVPANTKAWIWRLAFLKPLACLLPFAAVTLRVLPAPAPAQVSATTGIIGYADVQAPNVAPSAVVEASPATSVDLILVAWGIGVAFVLLYGIANWVRVVRMVRRADPIRDPGVYRVLMELSHSSRTAQRIRLLSSDEVKTPFLIGIVSPLIVLPRRAIEQEPIEDIRLMLAHELAHLVRKDLVWFGLVWVVQSFFFFNPVVWLAARCARIDHESATDEHASNLAAVPIQTYAEMLLRATVVARTSLAPGVLPMSESYRTIHRRIEAMKHFQSKPSPWRKSAFAALALAIVGLLPVYQLAEASPSPDQKPTSAKPQKSVKKKPAKRSIQSKRSVIVPGQPIAAEPPRAVIGQPLAPAISVPGQRLNPLSSSAPASVPGQSIAPAISVPGQRLNPLSSTAPAGVPGQGLNPLSSTAPAGVPGQGLVPSANVPGQSLNPLSSTAPASVPGPNPIAPDGIVPAGIPSQSSAIASPQGYRLGQELPPTAIVSRTGSASMPAAISRTGQPIPPGEDGGAQLPSMADVTAQGVSIPRQTTGRTTYRSTGTAQNQSRNTGTTLTYRAGNRSVASTRNMPGRAQTTTAVVGRQTNIPRSNSVSETIASRRSAAFFSRPGKVTMKFESQDVRQVLQLLFEQGQKNFVIDEKVKGNITVSFTDLSFEDCLDAILKTVDATYRVEKGIYRVSPRGK